MADPVRVGVFHPRLATAYATALVASIAAAGLAGDYHRPVFCARPVPRRELEISAARANRAGADDRAWCVAAVGDRIAQPVHFPGSIAAINGDCRDVLDPHVLMGRAEQPVR